MGELFQQHRPPEDAGLQRRLAIQMIAGRAKSEETAPTVGRYRIERKLGAGGMGVVYQAVDPELERTVALKVLRTPSIEEHRQTLRDEARALARLAHPNVVTVHDVGMADDHVYLTMEHVEGVTLRDWMEEGAPRSWREILSVLMDAGRGLAAAHDAGVIHRDFKPENVLIGHDGRVRVADFGLARNAVSSVPDAIDAEGLTAGTPAYWAPEVEAGEAATERSDQWSFCRTLNEALEHREKLAVGQGEPEELWALVRRGMEEQPRLRHDSMSELLAGLERVLIAPVPDERREQVLERVAGVLQDAEAASSLTGVPPIALAFVERADLVASGGATRMADTRQDTGHVLELFDRSGGSLLLLGQPGAGKSTTLRALARSLIRRARRDATQPLPVILNLSSLGSHAGPMDAWVCEEVAAKYGIPVGPARARLKAEAWVLLLDGLDEVDPARLEDVIGTIGDFRRDHPCSLVVAGRESVYEGAEARLDVRAAVTLAPLDRLRAADLRHALGSKDRIDESQPDIMATGTPLLLTLSAVSGTRLPLDSEESAVRAKMYRVFVEHALERVPASERKSLAAGLSWLAKTMRDRSLSELWLERLQADWLPGRAAPLMARGIGLLLLAVVTVGGNLLATWIGGRELLVALILGPLTLPVVLAFNRGLRVRPIDQLRFSWRRSLRRFPLALVACVAVGAIYGAFYEFWNNVIAAAGASLIISYPLGLESGDDVLGLRPNRSIRRSLTNAAMVGSVTTVLSGLSLGVLTLAVFFPGLPADSEFWTLEHPYWGAFWVSGAVMGIPAALAAGGTAVLLHSAVRLVLAMTTPLPLKLMGFFDRAVECGLLRRVGGGYVFPHRTLMEHLAKQRGG